MIIIGLTGSIASGKSTVTALLRTKGIHVFDADVAVHQLYADPVFVAQIEKAFPGITTDGTVDRTKLSAATLHDPNQIRELESMVHPHIRKMQNWFLESRTAAGDEVAVLDIPLLFETGQDKDVDVTIFVYADEATRRKRAEQRPTMTEQKWQAITTRQMSDSDKRNRVDFIIENNGSKDALVQSVSKTVDEILNKGKKTGA
jgi:dephospho-CoA kinase